MNKILFYIVYSVFYVISLLPLRVLYVISDVLFVLVFHLVRYRRHLVQRNLTSSFPKKTPAEIAQLEKGYYHWFCDYIVETLKLCTISREQMMRRMQFTGQEALAEAYARHQSCAVYLGHYCNWEWISSSQMWLPEEMQVLQVYHPLENAVFDRIFLTLRARFGSKSVSMANIFKEILNCHKRGEVVAVGFIADQVPIWNSIHYWTDFLNHDTPVFTGAERIARHQNMAVFYIHVERVKRGYYTAEFRPITNEPKLAPADQITEQYMRMLEDTITAHPQYWLWTHNRWKRTREQYAEVLGHIRKN